MKTRLYPNVFWTLGWLGVVLSVQAQGRLRLNNNFVPTGSMTKAFVFGSDGIRPQPRAEGRVQVLNAADGTTLTPNGDFGIPLVLDGLFFVNVVVPGVPVGESLKVVLRAWRDGNTYEEAAGRSQVRFTVQSLVATEFGPDNSLKDTGAFGGMSLMWRTPAGGFQLQTPTRSPGGTWSIPVALVVQQGLVFQPTHAQLWSSTNLTHWTRVERRWFYAEPGEPWPVQVLTAPDTGQTQWFKLEW